MAFLSGARGLAFWVWIFWLLLLYLNSAGRQSLLASAESFPHLPIRRVSKRDLVGIITSTADGVRLLRGEPSFARARRHLVGGGRDESGPPRWFSPLAMQPAVPENNSRWIRPALLGFAVPCPVLALYLSPNESGCVALIPIFRILPASSYATLVPNCQWWGPVVRSFETPRRKSGSRSTTAPRLLTPENSGSARAPWTRRRPSSWSGRGRRIRT